MFGNLVAVTEETRADILGDLFQGSITYGERGQFMTPPSIAKLMAQMNVPSQDTGLDGRRTVNDPCCGSGRMLLAVADIQPHWHFVGQDVDLRCTRMTAINLALRNCYGHVVHGNSLSSDVILVYETGRVQVWGNAIRKVGCVPLKDRAWDKSALSPSVEQPASSAEDRSSTPMPTSDEERGSQSQRRLF
jgi:hypothetical protein